MTLHLIPLDKLRDYYKHGRISEQELIEEIESREDAQPDTQEYETPAYPIAS